MHLLIGELMFFQETFAIQVVDGVLEDIRLGMEVGPMMSSTRYFCRRNDVTVIYSRIKS